MARARLARTPTPGQLSLDDWVEMLSASPEPLKAAGDRAASRARGRFVEGAAQPTSRDHPAAAELLETAGALLTRTHLRELGLERRAVDAVFRALPVVALPGYSRPMIRAEQYMELLERSSYDDDRVRPAAAMMSGRLQSA
jgi:hypothetical protein